MLRRLVGGILGVAIFASVSLAFDVKATIKKVDADERVVVFTAKDMDHTIKVPKDAKVFDAAGKELADGLKAKELKPGAEVTLTVDKDGDQRVLKAIRLGAKGAPAPAKDKTPAKEEPKPDTSNLVPLTDLGLGEYKGFKGGLYPDGKNERPAGHTAKGEALAKTVQPLDADGKPNANGKIVVLGIGFSNSLQVFNGFMEVAKDDKELNPNVVLVNGAMGGLPASAAQDAENGRGKEYWKYVDKRLKDAGVTGAQVQVVWIKETNPAPHEGGFPKYTQDLHAELVKIAQIVAQRFPNLKLTYLTSRSFGGWAITQPGRTAPGNSEPYSYETGFAVKWLIEQQLKGDAALNFDPAKGAVKAPWLSWGPYIWANGETKRKDGFSFKHSDYTEKDQMHHSPEGRKKMGLVMLQFFKTDPTTKGWFVKK